MKYNTSIKINAPTELVQELLIQPKKQLLWQTWLSDLQPLSGEMTQKGAVARLTYVVNGKKIVMTETILENTLPDKLVVHYNTVGADTTNYISLSAPTDKQTTIQMETEVKSKHFALKVLMWLLPTLFKKQTHTLLQQLKEYAERQA